MSPMLCAVILSHSMKNPDFEARKNDWRLGPVVYQIFVDRFAPSADLESKRAKYGPNRTLKPWNELPKGGTYNQEIGVWGHELDHWGGDLASTTAKLDHVVDIGPDLVYLQPIFEALTNHKYDTWDYYKIDPVYGTMKDFDELKDRVHKAKMKLVLDGVFNHVGHRSPVFLEAFENEKSKRRKWFRFDKKYKFGYESFANVKSLPRWNLENKETRDYLWNKSDSVVKHWLKNGVDGWRLDVAFEIGPKYLDELTKAAKQQSKDSLVVAEINGYPSDWFPNVDGTFNFYAMDVARAVVGGMISPRQASEALQAMVDDAPMENLLQSWIITDNHDTSRFASVMPNQKDRAVVQAMQFTLPGAPVIFYGTELGMAGEGDPGSRAPMNWDLVSDKNKDLAWVKKLVKVRKSLPSLRYGDYRTLPTEKLIAYQRTTDKLREAAVVVVNPTDQEVTEIFPVRIGRLMSWSTMRDELGSGDIRVINGLAMVKMPPKSAKIYRMLEDKQFGYSQSGRID